MVWRRLAAAVLLLAGSAVAAHAETYPWDLPAGSPALKAWKKVVPKSLGRERWLVSLNGTGTPLDETSVHGRAFWSGFMCKPHDCGSNKLVFLLAKDGSEAFGLYSAERDGQTRSVVIGAPDGEANARLDALLKAQ